MLVRISGRNYRSFRDDFELSMVAADLPSEGLRGCVELPIAGSDQPLTVLRSAAIYGPNASGKSTVLLAAKALRWMIQDSARLEPDDSLGPYEPFLLDEQSAANPVALGCVFWHQADKELYEYKIEFLSTEITFESLCKLSAPDSPIFLRQGAAQVTGTLINGSDLLKALLGSPRLNISVLSLLSKLGSDTGEESIVPLYKKLLESLNYYDFQDPLRNTYRFMSRDRDANMLHDDPNYREWVLHHLIHPSDLGIDNIETDVVEVGETAVHKIRRSDGEIVEIQQKRPDRVSVSFRHSGDVPASFSLSQESAGTKKMYGLARHWHRLSRSEDTYFADELSASLHPELFDQIIRAVNSKHGQKPTSQLIFATHETALLEGRAGQSPALRRDQVYFTEKDSSGASKLFALAEFGERSEHNIRKRYLSNRYGALPNISGLGF